jgi:hypothetical protein
MERETLGMLRMIKMITILIMILARLISAAILPDGKNLLLEALTIW